MSEEPITPAAEKPEAATAEELTAALSEPVEPQVDPTGRVVDPGERKYIWGTGRRKSAVARVRVRPGSGGFVVNGKPVTDYFAVTQFISEAQLPLTDLGVGDKVDVAVKVHGSGPHGQAGAVRLGLGRALIAMYPDAERMLRDKKHLSRDPRKVERKKYGLKGARKAYPLVKR